MEAKSTAKLLGIVGISKAIMFGIMQCFILYTSYMNTGKAENALYIEDIGVM